MARSAEVLSGGGHIDVTPIYMWDIGPPAARIFDVTHPNFLFARYVAVAYSHAILDVEGGIGHQLCTEARMSLRF